MQKLLILCFLLFVTTASVHAQNATAEPDQKWWWAWRESSGEVIAFDENGHSNVIAKAASTGLIVRVSSNLALIALANSNTYAIYLLTPETAIQIGKSQPFEEDRLLPYLSGAQMYWPKLVIASSQEDKLIVLDLVTHVSALLDEPVESLCGFLGMGSKPVFDPCVRISADGQFLRYAASITASDGDTYLALRERNLMTGVERDYPHDGGDHVHEADNCEAGAFGENWLCYRYAENNEIGYNLNAYWLVSSSGVERTLVEESVMSPLARWSANYSYDHIVVFDRYCEKSCTVAVLDTDGRFSAIITVPDEIAGHIRDIRWLRDDLLLLGDGVNQFLLDSKSQLQELGAVFCCELLDTLSPDRRWIVDAQHGFNVWDLQAEKMKFHLDDGGWPRLTYTSDGFILGGGEQHDWVYFNGDDNLINLPVSPKGKFRDIMSGRTLLYVEPSASDGTLAQGIYRYDPQSQEYTLLLVNATLDFDGYFTQ